VTPGSVYRFFPCFSTKKQTIGPCGNVCPLGVFPFPPNRLLCGGTPCYHFPPLKCWRAFPFWPFFWGTLFLVSPVPPPNSQNDFCPIHPSGLRPPAKNKQTHSHYPPLFSPICFFPFFISISQIPTPFRLFFEKTQTNSSPDRFSFCFLDFFPRIFHPSGRFGWKHC